MSSAAEVIRPDVSVVVPTFRRWDRLQLTLAALEKQTLPKDRFEVIISDDGSNDGTMEHLNTFARNTELKITVTTGPNAGPSAARNRGLEKASGAWVAFTDDDCVPAPDWLEEQLSFLNADPGLDGSGGGISRYSDGRIARYVDWTGVLLPSMDLVGTVRYLVTANAVFRREKLNAVGGFNETYKWPGGEDPDLSFRVIAAGGRLGYQPKAVVLHMHRESVKGTYRMFWHHGLGAGIHEMLTGVSTQRTLWGHFKFRTWPNMKMALAKEPLMDALVFCYLELVRMSAFRKGYEMHAKVAETGGTSAN